MKILPLGLAIAALALSAVHAAPAASQTVDIPSGGTSGAPWGGVAYVDTGAGRMNDIEMGHQGATALLYDFSRSGWASLFPIGYKPAAPYVMTRKDARRIRKAAREWAREKARHS